MNVLNTKQAAKFLHMHPVTLTKKAKAGIVPAAKPSKKWLFYEAHLIEYLRGNFQGGEAAAVTNIPAPAIALDVDSMVATKVEYYKALGISDCPQTHSPAPDPLRGARHARAAYRVAASKAVGLVGNSLTCHNRPADDVRT